MSIKKIQIIAPGYTNILHPETDSLSVLMEDSSTLESFKTNSLTRFNNITIDVTQPPYNAVGDGISDPTSAIQSALNLSKTFDSVNIIIPPGIYRITARLIIYKNTHIKMTPNTTLLRCYGAGFFLNGDATDMFTEYNGNGNITIDGGILDGNVANFPQGYNCIAFAKGRNITFKNMTIKDVIDAHAMDINGCKDVLIENCKFIGYIDSVGTSYYKEAIQLSNHSILGFNSFGNYDGSPCVNVTVRGCYFGASGTVGTTAYPVGVGNHGAVYSYYENDYTKSDLYTRDIYIYNNTFEGMTFSGVRPFKFKNTIIKDNFFIECHNGVSLSNPGGTGESDKDVNGVPQNTPQSSIGVVIKDNMFKKININAVYCVGWALNGVIGKVRNVVVEGNVIIDQKTLSDDVMYFKNVSNLTVCNNSFNNVGRGINITYVDNCIIENNNADNMALEFIYISESDNGTVNLPGTSTTLASGLTNKITISNNFISNTLYTGIFINYCTNFICKHNTLVNPATLTDNTRSGITVASYCNGGIVAENKVKKATTGNVNKYGLDITSTTSNIQEFNNNLEGKTGRLFIAQVNNNFSGSLISSPNGTRYRMSVSDAGVLTAVAY